MVILAQHYALQKMVEHAVDMIKWLLIEWLLIL